MPIHLEFHAMSHPHLSIHSPSDARSKRAVLRRLAGFLLICVLAASSALGQIGSGPCTPTPLGELPVGSPLVFTDDNSGIGPSADPWPDCVGDQNNRWFQFRLPPGYTNVQITVQSFGGFAALQASLFDTTVCSTTPLGAFIPGTDVCGLPGLPITLPPGGTCLPNGSTLVLRIASNDPGLFQVVLQAIEPNCADGCLNGFETVVDSIAKPDILVSSIDSSLCAGDLVFLQVSDPAAYTSVVWSTGFAGGTFPVNLPGSYSVVVTDPAGCSAEGEIRLFFDTTCVWPGDADRNNRVEARDLLPIGLAFITSGPPRSFPGDPFLFIGQAAPDWVQEFSGVYSGLNYKHADTDGSGVIDGNDTVGLRVNYGLQVPVGSFADARFTVLERAMADPPLSVTFASDSFEVGDTIRGQVVTGDTLLPVSSLYGISFHLLLPTAFIDESYLNIDFTDAWLDDDGNVTAFAQYTPGSGYADIGFSRTDQVGRSGIGTLLDFAIVVEDNLDGRVEKTRMLPFGFDYLLAIDSMADSIALRMVPDSVLVSQFCDSRGLSTAGEYIDGFKVNSKKVLTGDDGGYRETLVTAAKLLSNTSYTFGFKPGFTGAPVDQHWRCWLDVNADGDFDDPGEMLVDAVDNGIFLQPITVPDSATLGWTTLRVQMKRADGTGPGPCETFANGEVEDYIVEIGAGGPRLANPNAALQVWPNPGHDRLQVALPHISETPLHMEVRSLDGRQMASYPLHDAPFPLSLDLGGLPPGMYALVLHTATNVYTGKWHKVP